MSDTPRRILVIEDDRTNRLVLERVLRSLGHEVIVAEDGRAGLALLDAVRPALVVLDLLTPAIHGFEVIQRLRGSLRHRRTPILVVSGKAYASDRKKAEEMGVDAFLAKPVSPEDLAAAVSALLDQVRVRFWGVRGSIATPGRDTVKYGGNTPCVSLERGDDHLILDAGTGLRPLGLALAAENAGRPYGVRMLITHTHWDHIQGFPFFVPAFTPGVELDVYGPPSIDKPLEKVLRGQMDPQYFPVSLGEMAATIRVHEIREPDFTLGPFSIASRYVNHPGVTLAYRVTIDGTTVVYATDCEPFTSLVVDPADPDTAKAEWAAGCDNAFVDFIRGADLYIADSQYSSADYRTKRGWGHTAWPDAVRLGVAGGVRRIALFSHDPMHDDDTVDRKVEECRAIVAEHGAALDVFPAVEGAAVTLGRDRGPAAG